MTRLLFYRNPVPLDKEAHRQLRLASRAPDYGFAAATNSVVLSGVEFVEAAKEYPILFVRAGERFVPSALLGMRDAENLFVGSDGLWQARYIPAFVRRYPFVLASGGEGNQTMTVCIDQEFPGFSTGGEGQPLFETDGEPSGLLQNAIKFLQGFQAQMQRTEIFVNRLHEHDLLVEQTMRVELPNGRQHALQGLMAVDERKLLDLAKPKVLELFRSGELSWIYAHLISLSNMGRLGEMLTRRVVQ